MASSAEHGAKAETPDAHRLQLLYLQATIAYLRGDDRQSVLEATQQALDLVPAGQAPPHSLVLRLADIHKDLGQDEAAEQAYRRGAELAQMQGHVSAALSAVCGRVLIARRYGRLPQAVAIAREALQAMAEPIERLGRGLPTASRFGR